MTHVKWASIFCRFVPTGAADLDEEQAPTSYAELFDRYYDYVIYIVKRSGIREQDAEDVASEILAKFYEKDFLAKFTPEEWYANNRDEFGSRPHKMPKFRGFLRAFVSKYVLQWRDKQHTRDRKEPHRCEEMVPGTTATYLDLLGPTTKLDSTVEYEDYVRSVRAHLSSLPKTGWRDLERAFTMMVGQIEQTGRVSRRELAIAFGVSETAVYQLVSDVRRAILDMP